MGRIVIKDGTRPDVRLCDTCTRSVILKGTQQGQEAVYCNALPIWGVAGSSHPGETHFNHGGALPYRVVECSAYARKNSMDEYTAKQIGWVLEVKAGKVVGFRPPIKKGED